MHHDFRRAGGPCWRPRVLAVMKASYVSGPVTALVCVTILAGCGEKHYTAVSNAFPSRHLAELRRRLPAGFAAPAGQVAGVRADLNVRPVPGLGPSQVHLAPFPRSQQLRSILAAVINLPVPSRCGRRSSAPHGSAPGRASPLQRPACPRYRATPRCSYFKAQAIAPIISWPFGTALRQV